MNYRAMFANDVCKLIVKYNNGDIDKSVKEVEVYCEHFFDCVRNFYEVIEEVPLMYLSRVKLLNHDNFDWSIEEYQAKILELHEECEKLYLNE